MRFHHRHLMRQHRRSMRFLRLQIAMSKNSVLKMGKRPVRMVYQALGGSRLKIPPHPENLRPKNQ